MRHFYFLFSCFIISLLLPNALHAANQLHVCTVATHNDPGLFRLQRSCQRKGVPLVVLGQGRPYPSNGIKLQFVKEYLDTLPDDDILLFIDGFDVIILDDGQTILEKFLSKNTPFFISKEMNFGPAFSRDLIANYPNAPTNFQFINSGGYIGYVKFIKQLFDSLSFQINIDDQDQIHVHFLKNRDKYCLDYFCDIFLSLYDVKWSDLLVDCQQSKILLLPTNTKPSIIHGNGPNDSSSKRILGELSSAFGI